MIRKTYILSSGIVHEVISKGSNGYATACHVLIPGTAQHVKVEMKNGQRTPVRGWPCAGCFEEKK